MFYVYNNDLLYGQAEGRRQEKKAEGKKRSAEKGDGRKKGTHIDNCMEGNKRERKQGAKVKRARGDMGGVNNMSKVHCHVHVRMYICIYVCMYMYVKFCILILYI